MRKTAAILGLVLVAVTVNAMIVSKENLKREGTVMLLQLAPVDPRSLIQGDYMRLDYDLSRRLRDIYLEPSGELVVKLDANQVASFVRVHHGEKLAPDEHLLDYRKSGRRVRLGAESFFFEEGQAKKYRQARYGELRVSENGKCLLTGLRDKDFQPL